MTTGTLTDLTKYTHTCTFGRPTHIKVNINILSHTFNWCERRHRPRITNYRYTHRHRPRITNYRYTHIIQSLVQLQKHTHSYVQKQNLSGPQVEKAGQRLALTSTSSSTSRTWYRYGTNNNSVSCTWLFLWVCLSMCMCTCMHMCLCACMCMCACAGMHVTLLSLFFAL